MRVLLVNDLAPSVGEGPSGGVETHLSALSDGLRSAGDQVELFAGEVRHRCVGRALDLWDPWARRALAAAAARFRPDVVHHHNVVRELSVAVLGVPRAAACVLSLHDVRVLTGRDGWAHQGPLGWAKRSKAVFDRAVVRHKVDLVVAHSEAVEGMAVRRRLPVRLVPVLAAAGPFGADAVVDVTPPSSGNDVLYAGRLAPEKGVEVLMQAFASVAPDQPGASLLVAGDGPERSRLEAMAAGGGAGAGHGSRVRFLGHLGPAELRRRMAAVRAVAVPSLGPEGGPVVVVEAAMAGRPVVATDAAGVGSVVTASGGGIVVAAGDAAAMAGALSLLLDDPAAADRMGASGRRFVTANHAPDEVVGHVRRVYEEAIVRRRARLGPASALSPSPPAGAGGAS